MDYFSMMKEYQLSAYEFKIALIDVLTWENTQTERQVLLCWFLFKGSFERPFCALIGLLSQLLYMRKLDRFSMLVRSLLNSFETIHQMLVILLEEDLGGRSFTKF